MRSKLIKRLSNRGFTLAEVLLAVAILAFALCGILATYLACFNLTITSKNVNIATSAAQGVIEEIRNTPYSKMVDEHQIMLEGYYYNLTLTGTNLYRLNFTVNNLPQNMGVVYISQANPDFITVTAVVCWKQGNGIIGEDTNLNGLLNTGEDKNGNNLISSTVELVTQVVPWQL
jgi:prepilin-type N-terminal cleavage/methylation domain-containing protein